MLSGFRELSLPSCFPPVCLFTLLFGQADRNVSILDMGAEELRVEPVKALCCGRLTGLTSKNPLFFLGFSTKLPEEDFFLPEGSHRTTSIKADRLGHGGRPSFDTIWTTSSKGPSRSTLPWMCSLPKKQYQWIHTYIKDKPL